MRNLLRTLPGPAAAAGLRLAAVTRHPELVPPGVEAVLLQARSQELRMAWSLPRLLGRLDASLVHMQHALPLRCPCAAVVTIHDLSFERDATAMGRRDRAIFRRVVPRAVRAARRVLAVSERTRADLQDLYGVPDERIVVTPNGIDPAFTPGQAPAGEPYVLAVGTVERRKDHASALAAARAAGLPLVVVGPVREPELAAELERGGARLEGYVPTERLVELVRGAVCLVQASRYEGFGLPVVEAMACGTPVVCVDDPALVEISGGACIVVPRERLAEGIASACAQRERLRSAGLERARAFSWEATAEATVRVYVEALGR
ncbi:MAG: glycosyltransferase family 1 protein [Thermoleophilia bacterium]|nr:glycosyltransferase family 1 protein [Thermoleophilia bacterium]